MICHRSRPIVMAITGASGSKIAERVIQNLLQYTDCPIHLVISDAGRSVWQHELRNRPIPSCTRIQQHDLHDLSAPIASGSYPTCGMAIAPCSMGTMAKIAHGIADNLIARAADVTLKERRPLLLAPRESPLSAIHLSNMLALANAGAIIAPPMLTFYNTPESIDAMVDQFAMHSLALLGFDVPRREWGQ